MEWLLIGGLALVSYACGSLSFAVLVSRVMGLQDPRTYGSGNPGATNVLRSGSKKAAILTLLLDALKGFVPVLLVRWFYPHSEWSAWAVAAVGLAAFVGHLWPVFFGFKGGKGVATAAGVIFGFDWALGLIVMLCWIAVAWAFRYSSLAALVSAIFAPLAYYLGQYELWMPHMPIRLALIVMAALLVYRHRENIQRLRAGTEGMLNLGRKSG
jgi:glycerol-3-phosphate acyltransferase PlsY